MESGAPIDQSGVVKPKKADLQQLVTEQLTTTEKKTSKLQVSLSLARNAVATKIDARITDLKTKGVNPTEQKILNTFLYPELIKNVKL